MMERKMVCISCPLGCRLTVTWSEGSEVTVKGNRCAKGESYAREEILAPKRVVTATVPLLEAAIRRLPVRTNAALPKEHIPALLNEMYRLEVRAPVRRGQILLKDFQGTGVDLVAARSFQNKNVTGPG